MPPERHSSPPPRPPRERHGGPGFGGGPGFSGGPGFGGPRRPPFGGGGHGAPRPPFTPPPPAPQHSVRLKDGEREIDVSGSAEFVRQTLDDLPSLLARLRGETPASVRPASIAMPPPPPPDAANGHAADPLEQRIFAVLERTDHPLSVAAIRKQLGGQSTAQQIRRILERAGDRVAASAERPAGYRLR